MSYPESLLKCIKCGQMFSGIANDIVIGAPCSICGGQVVVTQQKLPYDKESPDITTILDQGIAAKRAGRFDQAIELYLHAQNTAPADERSYGNLAKILTGVRRYDEALRYWLILCEVNRLNAYGGSVAYIRDQHRFLHSPLVWNGRHLGANQVNSLLKEKPYLSEMIYRADNLTFYIGHCVVSLHQQTIIDYHIPIQYITNLESALLGRPIGDDLRDHQLEYVFLLSGYFFSALNIIAHDDHLPSLAAFYLDPGYKPSLALDSLLT